MPYEKTNSKSIIDLNVKHKTIKLLEDNLGENLDGLGCGNNFLDTTSRDTIHEKKIDKQDFIKMKISAPQKTVSREWEDQIQTGRKYLQKAHLIKAVTQHIQRTLKAQQ